MINAVVKLGGRCLEEPQALAQLGDELNVLVREGRWITLVHGGGVALDEHLMKRSLITPKKEGIRITPPEIIPDIVGVLAGVVNKRLVTALQHAGVKAVGLTGADGGSFRGEKLQFKSFDPGRVGKIVGGDPGLLNSLMARGYVPALAPLAPDADGEFLNINADSFAAGAARILNSKTLILLTDVPGVLDAKKQLIPRTTPEEIENLIETGVIRDGMIPKIRAALDASVEARCEVVIAPWNEKDIISRVLDGANVGTTIAKNFETSPTLS